MRGMAGPLSFILIAVMLIGGICFSVSERVTADRANASDTNSAHQLVLWDPNDPEGVVHSVNMGESVDPDASLWSYRTFCRPAKWTSKLEVHTLEDATATSRKACPDCVAAHDVFKQIGVSR